VLNGGGQNPSQGGLSCTGAPLQRKEVVHIGGTSASGRLFLGLAVLLLLVLTLLVTLAQAPKVDQANATAILTLVTAGAVAIERVIEALWTVVGANGKQWWPFSAVGERVDNLLGELNANLVPLQEQANTMLEGAGEGAGMIGIYFPNLQQAQWLANTLNALGPSNRRARNLAKAASTSAQWFETADVPEAITGAAQRVRYTANTLTNFLDTFNDNPARRLISILLGCIIGVIAAWVLGLDALQATLGTKPFQNVGTTITGIAMGLGANPTHELIKTLQETKQRRRTA
jgi:hypothetical protein